MSEQSDDKRQLTREQIEDMRPGAAWGMDEVCNPNVEVWKQHALCDMALASIPSSIEPTIREHLIRKLRSYAGAKATPHDLQIALGDAATMIEQSTPSAIEQRPVAWLHRKHPTAHTITDRVKQLWIDAGKPEQVENYTMPVYSSVPSATSPHSLAGEQDTKLLGAFTPAKTMAPGFELEYWNLTMVRMQGDVVLTVRLPSLFSHYVQTPEGRMAAWHPGAVSSVRFTRDLWRSFVKQIGEADKVFKACDELDRL